jgi:uncharacterized protein
MALKDCITDDMKAAMRAKDAARLSAIRMLLAAIKQREIDARIVLDDAQTLAIVDKLIKQRRDSVAAFSQAGRTDLVDKENAEIAVLGAYLPQQAGAAEISAEIEAALAALAAAEQGAVPAAGPQVMGKVMAILKPKLAGRADLGQVSAQVKARLSR